MMPRERPWRTCGQCRSLLFIVSACISAALVLGYPAVLVLGQRIREAVMLAAVTVAWLALLLAAVIVVIGFGVV